MIAVAAVSGAMAMTMPAFADCAANASPAAAPGLISGNGVQQPVLPPVDLSGDTVNLVGVLNSAAGTTFADEGSVAASGESVGGAKTSGEVAGRQDAVSDNGVQAPVDLGVIVGGSVNLVGIGNPAIGNGSVNTSDEAEPPAEPEPPTRHTPPAASRPEPTVPAAVPPAPAAPAAQAPTETAVSLADTGTDATVPTLVGGAALVLGGAILYRRFRPGAER
ncbi:chaplin family protein [Streptomyces sp. NPDC014995]|uniref:chaplin family protein n=1 Tax=Streptomyces sp. NPDC014995 TaxID=3364936 RepID=UPI0036FC9A2F